MAETTRYGGISVEFQPMSPDEIERTMQFLLRQQAQFAADFEKLSVKTDRMTDALVGLTGIVGRLAEAQGRTDERLSELQRRTEERFAALAERADHTEAHLNVLVDMFERHLREDHGRRPS